MAETPDEIYERVLAEEKAKGSSPQVAEARAKAARLRARKGLPIDPQAAAAAEAAAAGAPQAAAAAAPAAPKTTAGPAPVPPESPVPGESPPAPAAASAIEPPATEEPAPPAPEPGGPEPIAQPAVQERPAAVATAAPPKGRGAAARAARAAAVGGDGGAAPDRIQRLLAVVKPEAIQRVEREPIDRVNVWPHLMAGEAVSLLVITVFLLIFSVLVNAPFRELANINRTPNPSKAPWYFLGLQEMLRYFHPQVAGVTIPQWIILGLMAAPFIDRNPSTKPEDRKLAIVMFTIFLLFFACLTIIGSIFRGPGFNWIYPWQIHIIQIFEL